MRKRKRCNLIRFMLLFCTLVANVHGQAPLEQPIAMIDEFGPDVVCENLAGRIDNWIREVLSSSPVDVGYAIVSGPPAELKARMYRRDAIHAQLILRSRDAAERRRFVVIEGSNSRQIKVQLLRSKPNDQRMLAQKAKWDFTFPLKKPDLYYESADDHGICPGVNWEGQFAEILNANPALRGHIVIYRNRKSEFEKDKLDFTDKMKSVPRTRVRYFQSKIYHDSGHYELWLVPPRNI